MSLHGRARLLVALLSSFCVLVVALSAQTSSTSPVAKALDQSSPRPADAAGLMPGQGEVTKALQARAAAARTNDPVAVALFTNELLLRTGFGGIAASLRTRVARAESEYREGCQAAISEASLVKTINGVYADLDLPTWMHTSIDQVHLQRDLIRRSMPRLWIATSDPVQSNYMSPAEAVFMVTSITYQKIFNPTFQIEPSAWVTRQRARMQNAPSIELLRLQSRQPLKYHIEYVYKQITEALSHEHSVAVFLAHGRLDALGLGR